MHLLKDLPLIQKVNFIQLFARIFYETLMVLYQLLLPDQLNVISFKLLRSVFISVLNLQKQSLKVLIQLILHIISVQLEFNHL